MVLDTLDNAARYYHLHPRFKEAFDYIRTVDLESIEVGKYPVDGKELHASVSNKPGYKAEEAKFECHNNYIDIQVCPTGSELLGWKARKDCTEIKEAYNEDKDVTFFADKPDTYFSMRAGQFAIFFPEDVHAPMIGEGEIKKLVVKIKL